jgi:hypothetical protein
MRRTIMPRVTAGKPAGGRGAMMLFPAGVRVHIALGVTDLP